ncbi:alpha/beta hydrolase [Gracilibacillus sp. YIM 98692]|uniref:alpha/beta hydrolase n=1 Tax=Gracilibacillus sp. YIM 98692 TaxID=2663532 RepID=UPI0013D3CD33|nr:alpha/beta hydrolase [Gracilibacillus sp. YIM 98692]
MYTNSHFLSDDEVKIFYRCWLPDNPKAFVLLIHGAGEHSGSYSHIGQLCMEQQIALVSPDLRGFGQSEGARGHVNQFTDYLNDINKLVQLLFSKYGKVPLFLFGHSLGGLIAIRYGQMHPQEVKGVILSSPAVGLRYQIPYVAKKMIAFVSKISPQLAIRPMKWKNVARKIRKLKPYLPKEIDLKNDPFITSEYTPRWLTELLQNGMHAISEAPQFQCPVLCFYDQRDPIVHPNAVQRFINAISITDKKYISFAEGFHRPWNAHHMDLALERFIAWVIKRL